MTFGHPTETYPQLSGPLFEAVQRAGLFADSKRFVDSTPVVDEHEIAAAVSKLDDPSFDLAAFVDRAFEPPAEPGVEFTHSAETLDAHIDHLWVHLTRSSDKVQTTNRQSRIPLPNPYIVPGGRFSGIFYWDSYFTAEGLAASGNIDLVRSMCDNFAYLIDEFGHIPNGNRLYFLSRSQPPLFFKLVSILERVDGLAAVKPYLNALDKEYTFWMGGTETVTAADPASRRVVRLPNGTVCNRYFDDRADPRPESYKEDVELAKNVPVADRNQLYRDLRAACESGWDFSSRWLRDSDRLETIRTTELVPVDLNAIMYGFESTLARWHDAIGEASAAESYRDCAAQRKHAIERYCWDAERQFYFDYDFTAETTTEKWTLAGVVPLTFGVAADDRADAVKTQLEEKFLTAGGLVTTLTESGQQWDYPNGWAPLQWFAVEGLDQYGQTEFADRVATRWRTLTERVFDEQGKLVEKYDVVDATGEAGGGEYDLQDGFGWTNGVTRAFGVRESRNHTQPPQP